MGLDKKHPGRVDQASGGPRARTRPSQVLPATNYVLTQKETPSPNDAEK